MNNNINSVSLNNEFVYKICSVFEWKKTILKGTLVLKLTKIIS